MCAAVSEPTNMVDMFKAVSETFRDAGLKVFPAHADLLTITQRDKRAKKGKGGDEAVDCDYQCNGALAIFKRLKDTGEQSGYASARDVAQAMANAVPISADGVIRAVLVAGPGFINIAVNPIWVATQLCAILTQGVRPPAGTGPKTVVVDFSSPNIAKEMHVGHLRSTIIGDALCRTLEFCGHRVLRTNHVGDWGTQFGMLISYLYDAFPDFKTNCPPISDLQAFYKAAKVRFDNEPDFTARARQEVVKLQASDPDSIAGWNIICEISRREFQKIYDRLDIKLEERGESFYRAWLEDVVGVLRATLPQPDVFRIDEGATCVWVPNPKQPLAPLKPLIVKKSDGGYTYATTDFAALKYRIGVQKADWIFYVVDSGQSSHLECVFEGARLSGYYDPARQRVEHVGFGVVLGEDGKKFKTRSGEVTRLIDLLEEAKQRAHAVLLEKLAERQDTMTPEQIDAAAAAIGYGCVKYADLRCNRLGDYVFSFDRMLDQKGNTAVYLLYQYVRLMSIAAQARERLNVDVAALAATATPTSLQLRTPQEFAVATMLLRFAEEVNNVIDTLLPSRLCDYIHVRFLHEQQSN